VFQAESKRDDGKVFHPICYNKFIKTKSVSQAGHKQVPITVTGGVGPNSHALTGLGESSGDGASVGGPSGAMPTSTSGAAAAKRARRKSLTLSPGGLPFLTSSSSSHRQEPATPLNRIEKYAFFFSFFCLFVRRILILIS
jgi:hypothetical protein